jgi:hypothetical protein
MVTAQGPKNQRSLSFLCVIFVHFFICSLLLAVCDMRIAICVEFFVCGIFFKNIKCRKTSLETVV